MFLSVFVLIGCAAIATRVMTFNTASRRLTHGLVGSVGGYVVAPLVGALLGAVPSVMIEPQYFTHPFIGCIAPAAEGAAYLMSLSGILLGFATGVWTGPRKRTHA